jgi:S1-C subfamily serine protease
MNTLRAEGQALSWGRSAFAVVVALVLVVLGLANISMRLQLREVEDGVLWSARPEGVTAIEVAPESAAAQAGIVPGDVLVAVNGAAVEVPADVIAYQHLGDKSSRLAY